MEYFRYDACEYDKGRRRDNISLWIKEAVRLSGVNSSSIILDLGCGTGSYALGLLEETHSTVIGLDPSSEMVNEGRLKRRGDINWIESVAESIPIRNEIIDLIFLSLVWHHLKDKHARAQSYTEY